MLRLGARLWMNPFRLCSRDGGRRKLLGGGFIMIPPGSDGLTEDGKWRLIRGEGFASRVSGTVRPQDPGGGAMPIAAPRRIMTNDVSDTAGLSGGGGAQLAPSRVSAVLVEETNAGDTSGQECPGEDQEKRPLADTKKPPSGTVSDGEIRSPCGRGALPPSVAAGGLLPVDVMNTPALSVEGPRSIPSRISVVLVDGTVAGDTPGRECPREVRDLRPQTGATRLAGVSVGGGDAGLPRAGETSSSLDVAGRLLLVVPAGVSSSDGSVVAGGPVGPCGTLSPRFHDVLGPLEHSVLDHAGPVGQRVAVGPVGLFGTLSPSDCHPAGPAGPYAAGGPVVPDETLQVLDPLAHSVLDHTNPADQHVAVGPVGLFGALSPSDCHPAGPAGPYVAGGPCWPR